MYTPAISGDMARLPTLLLLLGLAVAGGAPCAAQGTPPGTVIGDVFASGTNLSLDHAMVTLSPAGRQTFSDEHGTFGFSGLTGGTYRLRVARLGFSPREFTVEVPAAGEGQRLRITLDRVSIKLNAVKVVAYPPCKKPGRPNAKTDPDLAAVFDQLTLNAEQYRLLADSFPFAYKAERRVGGLRDDGLVVDERTDTLTVRSDLIHWRYRPGDLVSREPYRDAAALYEYAMHLPTLPDFAEPSFYANHCFFYGGVETGALGEVVRIDFRAADKLSKPDVHGTILLDAQTMQIRLADLELSKIPSDLRDVVRVSATTRFSEVNRSIVIFSSVRGLTAYRYARNAAGTTGWLDEQRLIAFGWMGADPSKAAQKP